MDRSTFLIVLGLFVFLVVMVLAGYRRRGAEKARQMSEQRPSSLKPSSGSH